MNLSGVFFLLAIFTFLVITEARQTCEPPDYPANGNYSEKRDKFQLGDEVIYSCNKGYILMGEEKSKCRQNGDWSNPAPFCDRKVELKNSFYNDRSPASNPDVIDGNSMTCGRLSMDSMSITLTKKGAIFAVRILFELGSNANIEVTVGPEKCNVYKDFIETKRWVLLECIKANVLSNSVKIQDKSDKKRNITICEVEVYAREEDSCAKPPDKRISNGYLVFTRTIAELNCSKNYKSDYRRLACEDNNWIENNKLECNEILCDPKLKPFKEPGNEWKFLDDNVRKISVGTRRQLKCSSGYEKVGSPDIIECQEDGKWTKTNATCTEILCDPSFEPTKGPGVEWMHLDAVQKNSFGTKRQLKCSKGYEMVGNPGIIECQNDRRWTRTNATCKADKAANASIVMKGTTLIAIIVVGILVVLIILALIGTMIYFVKKQRGKEVVVVYSNPPTEGGSVIGSETDYASGYYETIQDTTPAPSTLSKSTPSHILSDGYTVPADNKGTFKRPPIMPADLAFNSLKPLKHCQLYG